MKHALLAASLLLVAGTAVGCGGAPTDASKEDFCEAYTDTSALQEAGEGDKLGEKIQDYGKGLEDVGTPKDISDDERDGFEVYVDALKDVDDDATAEDLQEPDVSKDDEKKAEKFTEYAQKKCG